MALLSAISYQRTRARDDPYVRDTVFERIVKVCLRDRFLNSMEQDELATRVLLAETTDFATKLHSFFNSELKERNYQLAHRILYERTIGRAVQMQCVEYSKGNGAKDYTIDINKLEPFLEKIGVRKS